MPPSLEVLNLGNGYYETNKFSGGIPMEWSSLTNLKQLSMANCGLSGVWFTRTRCLRHRENPGTSQNLPRIRSTSAPSETALSPPTSRTVTEEELHELLPNCERIHV